MSIRNKFFALIAAFGLFAFAVPGCGGGGEGTVVEPPTEEEPAVPGGEMSEEEYAKEMGTQ